MIHLADPTLILKNQILAEAQTQIINQSKKNAIIKVKEAEKAQSPLGPSSRVNM